MSGRSKWTCFAEREGPFLRHGLRAGTLSLTDMEEREPRRSNLAAEEVVEVSEIERREKASTLGAKEDEVVKVSEIDRHEKASMVESQEGKRDEVSDVD